MFKKTSTLVLAASLFAAGVSANQPLPKPNALQYFQGTKVGFSTQLPVYNSSITVRGPNGYHATVNAKHGMASLELLEHGQLNDGLYQYRMVYHTDAKSKLVVKIDDESDGEPAKSVKIGKIQSGHFYVEQGVIKAHELLQDGTMGFDFIAENLISTEVHLDRHLHSSTDRVAILTKVVKEQQQTIEQQKQSILAQQRHFVEQQQLVELLATRIDAIETSR